MSPKMAFYASTALGIVVLAAGLPATVRGQQVPAPQGAGAAAAVQIDGDDIGGVVTGRFGPEAGVWVIAETTELGTRFAKMVVTDDLGRYVLPDLPKATYSVWVRGYGLVDSPKVKAEPGKVLNLRAAIAPSLSDAAQYYPAIYWSSMIRFPDKSKFPGTGPIGNGIPVEFKTQDQWLNVIKTNGCGNCHQIGNYATRTIPEALGHFDSSIAAWARRLQSGAGRRQHDQHHRASDDAGGWASRRALPTGPTASRPASCRRRRRRGRPASSVTSSSPCATGRTRSTICTT